MELPLTGTKTTCERLDRGKKLGLQVDEATEAEHMQDSGCSGTSCTSSGRAQNAHSGRKATLETRRVVLNGVRECET